jgi:hypothetical protein
VPLKPDRASARTSSPEADDPVFASRRLLVGRIAASPLLGKSVRLRDLFLYLCDRVLDGAADEIHEHEVGHRVFGRAPDYDATADNIVRVHASQLRKRLAEYFATEGADEPVILEIPRGNYAPVFRERTTPLPPGGRSRPGVTRPVWVLGASTAFIAIALVALAVRQQRVAPPGASSDAARPIVHQLWSQLFQPNRPTDIVLDDAAVGVYQDLTGHSIALNDYYDRSYQRKLPETLESGSLDRDSAASVIIRRYSSYSAVAPLWRLFQISESEHGQPSVQFARDYSFHALKADNVILLGNRQTNLWMEPFESGLGLRWAYDKQLESSYPIDSWAAPQERERFHSVPRSGETRQGYCGVALVPNLGATGSALLISATGGSAIAACSDFLVDESAVSSLRQRLGSGADGRFPYFEALLQVRGRSTLPKDVAVLLCRAPRP